MENIKRLTVLWYHIIIYCHFACIYTKMRSSNFIPITLKLSSSLFTIQTFTWQLHTKWRSRYSCMQTSAKLWSQVNMRLFLLPFLLAQHLLANLVCLFLITNSIAYSCGCMFFTCLSLPRKKTPCQRCDLAPPISHFTPLSYT